MTWPYQLANEFSRKLPGRICSTFNGHNYGHAFLVSESIIMKDCQVAFLPRLAQSNLLEIYISLLWVGSLCHVLGIIVIKGGGQGDDTYREFSPGHRRQCISINNELQAEVFGSNNVHGMSAVSLHVNFQKPPSIFPIFWMTLGATQ